MNHIKDERGSIIVEASISFVLFVAVIASIITLINLVILHDRVQYAATQTVCEISNYTYLYSAAGVQNMHDDFKQSTEDTKKNVDEVLSGIGKLSQDVGDLSLQAENRIGDFSTIKDTKDTYDQIESMASNPEATLKGFLSWGLDGISEKVKTKVLEAISKPFIKKYLEFKAEDKNISADQFLRAYGVVDGINGLNMDNSNFLIDNRTIDLVVEYDVKFRFALIPLDIHMVQRAVTAAWLDGDGGKYE